MAYEPIFKLPYSNIFITDLFVPAYGQFDPITTIKNGKWEFFLPEKILEELSEQGFGMALEKGTFNSFEERYKIFVERTEKFKKIKIKELSKEKFISFLKEFKQFVNEFFSTYKETEFFYFKKIETELNNYIKETKHSFEDILSNKVDLASWPEEKRKLADYIISMQHLKFEYRKLLNDLALRQNSLLSEVLGQIIARTNREDSTSMTAEEIEKLLRGIEVKNYSDRHIYSFVKWNNEKKELIIVAGGEAYRKIRELEKEIPKEEVIGTPASKGFAKGKVRIILFSINPEEHLHKFQEGEILVSTTTGPEMVVIMEKAAAIVTDEGGLMSHAAIVSREFGIPCVVGTKYATEIFKDGDEIEVNANNGVVRKILKINKIQK